MTDGFIVGIITKFAEYKAKTVDVDLRRGRPVTDDELIQRFVTKYKKEPFEGLGARAQVTVVHDDGRVAGGAVRGRPSKTIRDAYRRAGVDTNYHGSFFYVDPGHRGQGLGRLISDKTPRHKATFTTGNKTSKRAVDMYLREGSRPLVTENGTRYWVGRDKLKEHLRSRA